MVNVSTRTDGVRYRECSPTVGSALRRLSFGAGPFTACRAGADLRGPLARSEKIPHAALHDPETRRIIDRCDY